MQKLTTTLDTYEQTISLINYTAPIWVNLGDMRGVEDLDFMPFYKYVKRLPYKEDPKTEEFLSRPAFILNPEWEGPRDCDDKTLAMASYCVLKNIPYRIAVMGRTNIPHHVTIQVRDENVWTWADPTYPNKGQYAKPLFRYRFCEFYASSYTKHMPTDFIKHINASL